MLTPGRLFRRLRALLTTNQLDTELDDELRFHIEMEVAQRIRLGMDERSARASALRDFGGVSRHRDNARDARGVRPLEDFLQDVRIAARAMTRQRTHTAVAVLTLAIGIGATTALGAAVYRVLIAPYPYAHADRIVTVWQTDTRAPDRRVEVSPANFLDWKERSRSFDLLAAAEPFGMDWVGPEGPESFETALVTDDFFPVQGLRPLIGRAFLADDFRDAATPVVAMTETLWRTRFGADSALVGRTLILDSIPRVVVGVMPRDAMQPYGAELWAPKIFRPDERRARSGGYWTVAGRLAPGVTIDQAERDIAAIAAQLALEFPATNQSTGATVVTLRESIAGGARTPLLVLLGAVSFVLLIACVNVSNLQLAESLRRRRELAIRTAIGAGRSRLVRQLLTESLLLSAVGCAAGLGIAYAGIAAIRAFAPTGLWQLQRFSLDGTALLIASALAVVSALAIGIMPVAASARIPLAESLVAGARSGASAARRRLSRILVVSELALALVLLVGAGLMLRTLSLLGRMDRGFTAEGVLVTTVQAWGYYPTSAHRAEYARQATERLASVPGVAAAGMTSALPLAWPIGLERARVTIEGQSPVPGDDAPTMRVAAATPAYFETLRIPIEAGRGFQATDAAGSVPVALVNRAFVRRYFADRNPIGARVTFGFMSAPLAREIVGVVGDVRHEGLHADPAPGVFVPHAQAPTGAMHLVVRSAAGAPALLQRRVRAELTALNGAMPLSDQTTMEALVGNSLRERRFQLGLFGAFSATALLLAAIGIYGVMNRATQERRHEIGVRMAVGAHAGDVRWMVLRNGGVLAVSGIVAGSGIAMLLSRFMAGMLFGVTPIDPLTYAGAAGVLLATAVLAVLIPAWRASRVDPVRALRDE
ncbi:MAG: ABC transporter permease [Gemmatimonadaceae bacterium]